VKPRGDDGHEYDGLHKKHRPDGEIGTTFVRLVAARRQKGDIDTVRTEFT
jgi:hypothetical protein